MMFWIGFGAGFAVGAAVVIVGAAVWLAYEYGGGK